MDKQAKEKLMEIAHQIIKGDLPLYDLKNKARDLYENLCVLSYINSVETVEKAVPQFEKSLYNSTKTIQNQDTNFQKKSKESLRETIPLDVMVDVFENAAPTDKTLNKKQRFLSRKEPLKNTFKTFEKNWQKQTLNPLNIGLNDRIAFVKFLFEGNQELYQKSISDLNNLQTKEKSLEYLRHLSKQMEWDNKKEITNRFKTLIKSRF